MLLLLPVKKQIFLQTNWVNWNRIYKNIRLNNHERKIIAGSAAT